MSAPFLITKKKVIIISGPTASGKTALAVSLAQRFQSDIFSADSRQIYTEMSIGTAKPEQDILAQVRHHFISNVSIHQVYTVGKYVEEMKILLASYFETHDVAIIVGGTGLYLNALIRGLDNLPASNPVIVEEIISKSAQFGLPYLASWLLKLDPEYHARVDLNNPHRIIRALAVSIAENKPYSSFLGKNKTPLPYTVQGLVLIPEREVLYTRIEDRVDLMVELGLEEEARTLFQYKSLNALQTVGYQEFFRYFEGEISRDQAIAEIKKNSRRYAKRQITWLKKYGIGKIFTQWDLQEIIQHLNEI